MREGVLLDDIYVSGGDASAGIDVIAEVRIGHRLQRLCFTEVGVTAGYDSAGVDVAKEHAHRDRDVADDGADVYARQIDEDSLRVGQSSAVHSHFITRDAGSGRVSGASGRRDRADWRGEAHYDGMTASGAATVATFNADIAREWQINIERAGGSVSLARDSASRQRRRGVKASLWSGLNVVPKRRVKILGKDLAGTDDSGPG